MYTTVKHLHLGAIALSYALFFLRGVWMMRDSPMLAQPWVRVLPHVNDSLLLAAGITLALMLQQYPLVAGWLTAKVFGLLVYIVLGTLALKRARTRAARIACWLAAQAVFGYIVAVALTKNPLPYAALF